MWDRFCGKIAWLLACCLTLSILLPCVIYLFNHQLAKSVGGFLGFSLFWIGCSGLAAFAVWYVGACIVGFVRWRLDVRADAMQARQGKESGRY
jgi:hypothetical protein